MLTATRRTIIGGLAASMLPMPGLGHAAVNSARRLPPPISSTERLQRLARARELMQRHGIGAIIVEPGASLD